MNMLGKNLAFGAVILTGATISAGAQTVTPPHAASYAGMMRQSVATSQAGYSGPPPCQPQRPVSMQLDGNRVVLAYKDWGGNTIHFRGTVDPTGAVLAWHTNGDGSRAAMNGQFGQEGFTGHLQRDNWMCIYDVTMQPAPAAAMR